MILLLIFISVFIGLNIRYSPIFFIVIGLVFLFILLRKYKKRFALFCSLIIFASIGISYISFSFEQENYQSVVIEAKENYYVVSSKLERLYVYEKNNTKEIGDIIKLQGYKTDLAFTKLESDFDFKEYLNLKGIYKQLNVNKEEIVFNHPIRLRNYKNSVLDKYSNETKSLINSIFGVGGDSEIKGDIESLHLSRLLSVSGIYLYVIMPFTTYLLSFVLKEKYSKLISILLTFIYLVFAFPKFAVIRIFTISIFRWINDYLLKKKFDYLTITCFSALLFLIFDYHNAYQDAFVLGFLLPIFLHFVNTSISVKGRFKKKAFNVLCITLFMIPFELKFYSSFNLLAYPLTTIFFPFFLFYVIFSIFVFCSIPLMNMMNGYTSFLYQMTSFFKPINISINVPQMNDFILILYVATLLITLYYVSIGFKPLVKHISLFSLTGCLFYILPIKNIFTSEVCFINVGQGDSTLIRKGNTTIMIDTGGSLYKDIANDVLIPYLKSKRIYNIDLLITTHDDLDHSGAAIKLQENFKVKQYVTSYEDFPISISGIELINLNTYKDVWSEDNDKSLVITFNLLSKSFLIMGDAPKAIEEKIISDYPKLTVDVLKVGHHGSETSTSNSFIKSIKPSDAVISVGKNYYGHPNKNVLKILNNNGVNIKRTDKDGTIVFN